MGDTDPLLTRAAIVGTVKSKWWVVPLVIGISIAILFAQESNLDTSPTSATVVRRYESREAYSALSALEIDAQAFAPMLSVNGQVFAFNSNNARDRRKSEHGFDALLLIDRNPGDFTVVNQEIAESRNIYSVISVGSTVFTMTCKEATLETCATALEVGEQEFETARTAAIVASIENVRAVLQARLDSVRRSIEATVDTTALSAQRQLEIELSSQIDALVTATEESSYSLELIDESQLDPSATVTSVAVSTYVLGAIIGAIVALLILLQFAVLRSRRR